MIIINGTASFATQLIGVTDAPATSYEVTISGMNSYGTVTISISKGSMVDKSGTSLENTATATTNYVPGAPTVTVEQVHTHSPAQHQRLHADHHVAVGVNELGYRMGSI
jgi:hypothetical protein